MQRSFHIKNELREIPRLAEQVEAFCEEAGVSMSSVYPINLVLDEWLTNLVAYAFDDDAEHVVEIDLSHADDGLTITVTDDGRAFNPLTDALEIQLESDVDSRQVGGLGIHFMKTLMDEVDYESADGVNRLILRKQPA